VISPNSLSASVLVIKWRKTNHSTSSPTLWFKKAHCLVIAMNIFNTKMQLFKNPFYMTRMITPFEVINLYK
jgi:hypothetical protein